MTSVRKKGTRGTRGTAGRIALGCALGTALMLTPAAAAVAAPDEPGPAGTTAPEAPLSPTAPVTGPVVDVDDTHQVVVPDEAAFAFLGAPGARVWDIEEPVDTAGLTLTGVEGPGALVVHRAGEEGEAPEPLVHSGDAEGMPEDGYAIPPRTADTTGPVARWAFTTPGTYRLTLAHASGETEPARRTTTLTVRVGDAAITTLPAPVPTPDPSGSTSPSSPPALAEPAPVELALAEPAPRERSDLLLGAQAAEAAPVSATAATENTAEENAATENSVEEKAATEKKVLDDGHLDIAARVVDGTLQIQVKDGTVPGKTTWREPSSVVLHVKSAARKQIPAGEAFSFLGKAGEPVWLLDQVQQEGLLWPGWSTDNVEAGALKGGVKFDLTKAEGPGGFALYTYDGLSGATVLFNSKDGVPDTIDVPANTHAHGGWAFGGEGVHRLTLSMTGTLANGSASTDTETFTFVVGDETAPGAVSPSGSGSGSGGSSSGPDGEPGSDDGGSASGGPENGAENGTENGADDGRAAGKGTSGSMAATGAEDVAVLGGGAVALAAAGTALVVMNRRREQRNGARA
ncbi:TIGR03773 family transporter-associated surface protein [Streptomyces sp. CC208A]|uniref:TIGR03773 family transporter-associated surface protein n=1 Tax=Streptomyces sp. CC208A TaxID=3044573 RepID=UPI0024A866D1|nr:TIGR03773 family transporter-associated surface protein [Streptomyces sp. CC208A]